MSNDPNKLLLLSKTKYQLEIVVSILVLNELDGLKSSKKEKTAQNAADAVDYINNNNIRLLSTSGTIIPGKLNIYTLLTN